jgi:hypothetical protein|nr:MAG TPA: hypothetical protein [Caudoviricetes sp.]
MLKVHISLDMTIHTAYKKRFILLINTLIINTLIFYMTFCSIEYILYMHKAILLEYLYRVKIYITYSFDP